MHELQPGTEEDSSNALGKTAWSWKRSRDLHEGQSVILLYQILYSSKLLNGTEALWIVGHMRKLSWEYKDFEVLKKMRWLVVNYLYKPRIQGSGHLLHSYTLCGLENTSRAEMLNYSNTAHQDYFYLIPLLQYQEFDSGFDQHRMPTSIIQSLHFQTTLDIFFSTASHVLVDFFINSNVHYLPLNFFLKVLCTVKLKTISVDNRYIAATMPSEAFHLLPL
ncbi:uncharacterized protein LOC113988084 isoform X1 [Pipra filicauda]|uniref:Uncharacterized protein LOC113988084 isoform X1 n=1 Tax=Pipra filicauda TaxID=649802 RepID=A0A7R5KAV1_9PASS|nr:uncharacterized protein LOC113988084 isoform X1 [Pipra filicauda]